MGVVTSAHIDSLSYNYAFMYPSNLLLPLNPLVLAYQCPGSYFGSQHWPYQVALEVPGLLSADVVCEQVVVRRQFTLAGLL